MEISFQHEYPTTQYPTPNENNTPVKSNPPKRKNVDGKYGWVIVFSSLMTSFLTSGISSSFGVLFVDFLQYVGSNKATTSIIGSLFFSIPLILGPFSSYCINKWGCRKVCITGSIITGVALSSAFFAQSLMHLLICFSLAGIGQSFCLLSSVIIIPLYFHHKLALASGLSVCGEGIGSFVFPPLVRYLLETFAWRGTLLILGAVLLNIAVFGSLMRNPKGTPRGSNANTLESACNSNFECSQTFPSHSTESEKTIETIRSFEMVNYFQKESSRNVSVVGEGGNSRAEEMKYRKRIFLRRGHLLCNVTFKILNFTMCRERNSSTEQSSFDRRESLSKVKKNDPSIRRTAGVQLLKNAPYAFFCVSNALLYACMDVPYIYLPDYANGLGIKMEKASFLLSIAGALNTVGVILMGYLGDLPKVNPAILYGCFVIISGIAIACLPLTSLYAVIAICMAIHGAAISVVSALDIVLLFGLIPEEDFATAYGLVLLVQGLATLIGSPLVGHINDLTHSYELPFYGTGALIVISGLIIILLMKTWSRRLQEHIQNDCRL